MSLTINKVKKNDFDLLKKFFLDYYEHEKQLEDQNKICYFPLDIGSEDSADELLSSEEILFTLKHEICGYYLIFEKTNPSKAIGLVYLEPNLTDGLVEESICFLPNYTGKGYGKITISWLIEKIKPHIGTELLFLNNNGKEVLQTLRGLLATIDITNIPSILLHSRSAMTLVDYQQYILPSDENTHEYYHGVMLSYPKCSFGLPGFSSVFERNYYERYIPDKTSLLNTVDQLINAFSKSPAPKFITPYWNNKLLPLLEAQKENPGVSLEHHKSFECQKKDAMLSSHNKLRIKPRL